MPVAFRLSKKFSETFGDELADKFVNWFNQMDTTYRTDLSELNDRNFAKLDARIAQAEARLDALVSAVESRFDRRLSGFESQMVERMANLEINLDRRMTALESRVEEQFSGFRADMASFKAELIKWMFLFWLGTVGTTVAVVQLLL